MTPEAKARQIIDKKLIQSGWVIQDLRQLNLSAGAGVAVREFPTSTGPADYALFVEGNPIGVIEAKKSTAAENLTTVEEQSSRYAHSTLKYVGSDYRIRFAYEATDKLIRFTDYDDIKFRSRKVFSFHQPKYLRYLLSQPDTIRNNMKHFPQLDETGFRKCQIIAIKNLDQSLADNRPKALVQMATGAGKTFTAITAAYRMLKYGKMNRILFLVDTKSLGEQAEREFLAYTPNDDARSFSQLYGVRRLKSSYIPSDVQICISTIQRMYSILKGEELDESAEEVNFAELKTADKQPVKEVVYNEKYPPEFFDCIIVDECHRSIYNVWSQVLTYFDSFIIGLTATPDKRTFAFFNQNVVSEYSREQAIVDGVNVGEDIFLIETEITKNGAHIMKQLKEKEYEEFQQYLYNKVHGYIWTPDTLELICGGNDNEPERIGRQVLEMLGRVRNEHISHMTSDKHKKYVIRSLCKGETDLLKDFLYEAIFIPEGTEPPARDIIEKPELRVYTDDFGIRKGDNCLVADFGGKVVGAIWTRIMDDYGHVDDETPSFAISLYKEYRGQGIGSQLMVKMLELLKWQGYERASLAVQKANYAVKMYKDVGFKTVGENAEEYIMVCEL